MSELQSLGYEWFIFDNWTSRVVILINFTFLFVVIRRLIKQLFFHWRMLNDIFDFDCCYCDVTLHLFHSVKYRFLFHLEISVLYGHLCNKYKIFNKTKYAFGGPVWWIYTVIGYYLLEIYTERPKSVVNGHCSDKIGVTSSSLTKAVTAS
jgi:hypothetical protein